MTQKCVEVLGISCILAALSLSACQTTPTLDCTGAGVALIDDLRPTACNYTCNDTAWALPACTTDTVETLPDHGALHIDMAKTITYTELPPASGSHRAVWAKWGQYSFLWPQRWVHNMEHGGVALLYDPCLDPATVAKLHDFAKNWRDSAGNKLHYVLTPFPKLPQPIMAVAWTHRWGAACLMTSNLDAWLKVHAGQGPEGSIAMPGSYQDGWLAD